MGDMIKFDCPDGSTAEGYLAEAPGSRAGVVVVQEWWGLNDQIKGTADRLARGRASPRSHPISTTAG